MTGRLKSPGPGRVRQWTCVRSVRMIALWILIIFPFGGVVSASSGEEVSKFMIPAAGKVSIVTERGRDGKVQIDIEGAVYDGRRFIKALLTNRSPANLFGWYPEFVLRMNVDTLVGFNGETLQDVKLVISSSSGAITSFVLSSKQGIARISGDLQSLREDRRTIRITSEDAGSFLRLFGLYRQISGGNISILLNIPVDGTESLTGNFSLRDFRPVPEPVMQRLEASTPNIGSVEHAEIPIELRGEFQRIKNSLWVRNGVICGPVWAASFAGLLNDDDLQLRGVLSLQPLLSAISLIRFRCGGVPNLIGLRYTLKAPRIFVNPTYELSPGEMRHIFEPPSR
jgi:hypothetical protein